MASQAPEKPLVILLHGLLRTRWSMYYASRKLSAAGFDVLRYGYPSRRFSIKQQAQRFEQFLGGQQLTGRVLHFVTHSLGSIVLRQFAIEYHRSYQLGRAVMLGPPNQGSRYAAFLKRSVPGLERFMGPAFSELCQLNMPSAAEYLEIGILAGGTGGTTGLLPFFPGDNDGIVGVSEAALPGAKDFMVLPGLHSLLVYHPTMIAQACFFLTHGHFRRDAA